VCNASNREKIGAWLARHAGKNVTLEDRTEQTVMVAIQGPRTFEILGKVLPVPIQQIKRYHFIEGQYLGVEFAIFRTGYTGEDGVEIVVPAAAAPLAGEMLGGGEDESSAAAQVKPAGLGARDTLRLEAGMPLYGHELNEEIDSISAGQAWCVDLSKDFIGVEAMRRVAERGPTHQLVGLVLDGKRTARQHFGVLAGGKAVGEVTSGTLSPTLGNSIAMAFVPPAHAAVGTRLQVDIKGKAIDAMVVPLPFYKKPKKPTS
jgi:aminomethyltransferase